LLLLLLLLFEVAATQQLYEVPLPVHYPETNVKFFVVTPKPLFVHEQLRYHDFEVVFVVLTHEQFCNEDPWAHPSLLPFDGVVMFNNDGATQQV
jgi:hypothetical protein